MRGFIVLIGLAMLALACTLNHGKPSANHNLNAGLIAGEPAIPAFETIPKDLLVTLERTVCYGRCPSYKLTIKADGSLLFEGRDFVRQKGIAKSQLSRDQLNALLEEFDKIKFFTLRDRYTRQEDGCNEVYTDHPTTTTSILIDGKAKKVEHYQGCRGPNILDDLSTFENKIDEIVDSKRWIN